MAIRFLQTLRPRQRYSLKKEVPQSIVAIIVMDVFSVSEDALGTVFMARVCFLCCRDTVHFLPY